MSLPNELKAMIMSRYVIAEDVLSYNQTPGYVDISRPKYAWMLGGVIKKPSNKRILSPGKAAKKHALESVFAIGNKQLFKIAEAEYYRANIFIVVMRLYHPDDGSVVGQDGVIPERDIADVDEEDNDERAKLLNLELKMTFTGLRSRDAHPAEISRIGQPEAEALKQLPGAYPKLRTLTIHLNHDIEASERLEDGYNDDDDEDDTEAMQHERAPGASAEVAAAEVGFLTNVLAGLKEVKRDYRTTRVSLRFEHCDYASSRNALLAREPVDIDGRNEGIDEVVWQVLDLPKALVKL